MRKEKLMALPLCFSYFLFFIICYTLKKGRRRRWLDYLRKTRNQLHNLIVSFFSLFYLTLLEKGRVGNNRRLSVITKAIKPLFVATTVKNTNYRK